MDDFFKYHTIKHAEVTKLQLVINIMSHVVKLFAIQKSRGIRALFNFVEKALTVYEITWGISMMDDESYEKWWN